MINMIHIKYMNALKRLYNKNICFNKKAQENLIQTLDSWHKIFEIMHNCTIRFIKQILFPKFLWPRHMIRENILDTYLSQIKKIINGSRFKQCSSEKNKMYIKTLNYANVRFIWCRHMPQSNIQFPTHVYLI